VKSLYHAVRAGPRRVLGVADDGPVPVRRLADVAHLMALTGSLYLRYSEGRLADTAQRSLDVATGCLLPGLSATPLTPEPWWDRDVEEWVARQLCQYAHLWGGDLQGWLVTGREVGRGADCEPLLVDVRAVGALCPECLDEASYLYRAVFAHTG
jgi:hypothetical protein